MLHYIAKLAIKTNRNLTVQGQVAVWTGCTDSRCMKIQKIVLEQKKYQNFLLQSQMVQSFPAERQTGRSIT